MMGSRSTVGACRQPGGQPWQWRSMIADDLQRLEGEAVSGRTQFLYPTTVSTGIVGALTIDHSSDHDEDDDDVFLATGGREFCGA